MTCIIGFVCPKNGKVYIGGDSAGVAGYSVSIRSDEKVFRNGRFIMGFTSSFRMGQLLRYDFTPPKHPKGCEDMKYLVSHFIPAVKNVFKDGGYQKSESGRDEGGTFLLGYRGGLYGVQCNYQVAKYQDNISAIGCGEEVALGAMYALGHLAPKIRIRRALEITSHLNAGVRPPFVIEELGGGG